MTQSFTSYPDWKAPAKDGEALIWPEPPALLEDTRENHRRLQNETAAIQGIAFTELRQRQRLALGMPDDTPVIATGHQTELIHPGVWAKNVLLHVAAEKIGARAIHFSVDTDAPKHLHLRWPGGAEPITSDPRLTTALWTGLLAGPSPADVLGIATRFAAASQEWNFAPMIPQFLTEIGRLSVSEPKLDPILVEAISRMDQSIGLKHEMRLASPMFQGEPYLVFAYHVLARAGEFAGVYNTALHEYRADHKLRTTARPMPDLVVDGKRCEVPFWLDDLRSELRERASALPSENGCKLIINGDELILRESTDGWKGAAELKDFLARHGVRLSPRALTLTAFLRLLIADQFVHGIGGGRYDQVTDKVIARFFGIEPPKFSVTTATLFFPAAVDRARACLPCIMQEGHHLRHQLLGEEKLPILRQIEQLPRRSYQRQRLFSQMHNQLAAAMVEHPSMRDWERRVIDATRQSQEEQSLFDRELFFAIQPRPRLEKVINQYQIAFAV